MRVVAGHGKSYKDKADRANDERLCRPSRIASQSGSRDALCRAVLFIPISKRVRAGNANASKKAAGFPERNPNARSFIWSCTSRAPVLISVTVLRSPTMRRVNVHVFNRGASMTISLAASNDRSVSMEISVRVCHGSIPRSALPTGEMSETQCKAAAVWNVASTVANTSGDVISVE
ncbi:unnamed protein product [Mycena citricolor]|uniref:Uncharacterized protein n=1 Tax=Mycena citricolor TaxID=2018698 RepID=A0AAD2H7Z9_9AGAR|nr:unnamed protein product [Mycena citricolor]